MTAAPTLNKAERTLTFRVPLPPRRHGSRKFVIGPEGVTWTRPRVIIDNTIVKALARAHRWKTMLESGEYASLTELARAEKVNLSYLCRILRLTLLAPDIVTSLLDGEHSIQLQLSGFLEPMSNIWAEQRARCRSVVSR